MKRINLLEILKDAPDGLVMHSVAHGQVRVYKRDENCRIKCMSPFRLVLNLPFGGTVGYLDEYGRIIGSGECVLFPNSVVRDWGDGWQNCLMIQEPAIGCIVWFDDRLYRIIGKQVLQAIDGSTKIGSNFQGFRFATEEETHEFYEKSRRVKFRKVMSSVNPGDLVLVRRQSTCESEQYRKWILGHFSHYDVKHDLYFTTECTAISTDTMMGYYDCIPYMDVTKSMLNTDQDIQFFTATVKW